MKISNFSPATYFDFITQATQEVKDSSEYRQILDILFACYIKEGVVYTMGCGGSASTATHFAADLAKTVISSHEPGFKSMALVDNIPLVSAWTNDKGWNTVFSGQLNSWLTSNDVLIAFSVHGGTDTGDEAGPWSQNLVSAMKLAKKRKATIIGFSGFDGGAIKALANSSIVVPINDETYGTAVVEAMHVVIFHALVFDLKQMIRNINGKKKTS